ncbi:LysR substrate-binding domain-containing protein [Leisingera sp. F5]|uniref:LysR substrate-binding domain-containing protein n=1 Tax=Leisingera sp. F5 TaxID=1813816 RepID=UPI0025B87B38|nr:LysR substrate-binding domain-containing protein [Leisingera sp. F5]
MKFKLRQLEAFQAVARTGSVTRAAETLGISQPAASRLLSDFSKSVAVELFTRKDGLLIPTSEARYLLSEVGRVFDSLNHLEELNRDLTERTAGHLRIACLPGFATALLPKLLAGFLEHRPGVRLTLEPDRPERILEWIIGEQYDCGITDGFAAHPAVENIDIAIRTVCVLPQDDPLAEQDVITPRDLRDRKIIHTRRDSPFFRRLHKAFSEAGVELNSWIEVRQFSTACIIISQGQGASVVSALDAEQFRGQNIAIVPFAPELPHRLSILRPVSGSRSLLALDFLDAFTDSLAPFRADLEPSRR